jgi:hypothetical protein
MVTFYLFIIISFRIMHSSGMSANTITYSSYGKRLFVLHSMFVHTDARIYVVFVLMNVWP